MTIKITSTAFSEGEPIPNRYTCTDVNVSPRLQWENLPGGAMSIAVICEDPDAPSGTWSHWVLFNLPADCTELPEWIMEREELENGARQGLNDFGTVGYRGPCPHGGTHRYYFKIYALDTLIDLPSLIKRQELLDAMEGHILDDGQLMGVYSR
ncbi:YbhB/YbcL family Raf kinase inhibitor-like protein [Methanobacterium aggregans]|uniref:YbhB/YbcL family Raf kinase inhibitor-like protein n=1 Tax=Methanobacterium aggregans TaxID=1615586 RepID=UPI001AE7BF0D|nr:YbhB/YbcL family Raf kinase inhibitor-like protein [Methanobacterium aggregans]MBP2046567.1 Raf kinase inhibitor-like YbhB/YbcL family protein [Methanobacterium aggregans]